MGRKHRGFTLLELMIVVVVVAILASFAIPSYLSQVRKSRRSDATSTLGDLQLRQERYRAENPTYGTIAQLNAPTTSSNGYYTASLATMSGNCPDTDPTKPAIAESTSNSYWLQAAAKSGTSQAKDTGCTTMLLKNECGTISKTPADCWAK